MINHILLATSGTDTSLEAEDYALYLTQKTNASLSVLYVVDDRLIHYGQIDQLVTEKTKEQFISYIKNTGDTESCQALKNFSEKAADKGIFYSSLIRTGAPEKEIVAAAGENSVDLLVLGGRRRKSRSIMPSSAIVDKVLKKSPCPVLIVDKQ